MQKSAPLPLDPEAIRPFFSGRHLEQLAERREGGISAKRDALAAVLFVDVAGCTALCEEFSQAGPRGAEELSALFDRLFGRINAIVAESGGDVITYAGDAVWAMWPVEPRMGMRGLTDVVCLATEAALALQKHVATDVFRGPSGAPVKLRASLGAGAVSSLEFGLSRDRSDFVVAGEGVHEAAQMDRLAKPGQVVLAPDAWRLVSDLCVGTPFPGGGARVHSIEHRAQASEPPPSRDVPIARLRSSLPSMLVERLSAGLGGWLAEFRTLTALFLRLPEFDIDSFDERWQAPLQEIRRTAEQLDGEVYQLLLDEKGFTAVLAFGLPGRSHEDDAGRGTRCALAIEAMLRERGMKGSMGIATGSAFCGIRGSDTRRQYTMVGSVMNEAARLMQQTLDEVRCDMPTVEAASALTDVNFERLTPASLRGKAEPFPVFRPVSQKATRDSSLSRVRSQLELVGRSRELEGLESAVRSLTGDAPASAVIVEGEPGIGKSRLTGEFCEWLAENRVRHIFGATAEVEQLVPYHAFRSVFQQLFEISEDTKEARAQVLERLQEMANGAKLRELSPLLSSVLPWDWEDNETTAKLTAQGRAENTRELLLGCLQNSIDPEPTVLVLEDAHWLDPASWTLVLHAARRPPRFLVVLTTRVVEPQPASQRELSELAQCRTLALGAMPSDDVVSIVRQELGVESVPKTVADIVVDRAAGNPLFASELACALRDLGLVTVAGDRCVLAQGVTDAGARFEELLNERGLPVSLQGVTTSRLDRLEQEEQIVVKVAAVIGHAFDLATLSAVVPPEIERDRLPRMLDQLCRLGILNSDGSGVERNYAMKHAITREIAYATVPFAQRRRLHRLVAEHLEQDTATLRTWPRLAHHWRRTDQPRKAVRYLARAGKEALKNYANEEGATFLLDALDLDRQFPDESETAAATRERHARWELDLGRAYCNWCRYPEAREHLEKGLGLLGFGPARNPFGLFFSLLWQVLRQTLARRWPSRTGRGAKQRDPLLLASRSYEGLAETYFNTGASVRCLLAALVSLNLAEHAGPSPELARGYASMGAILGFIPAHSMAQAYCQRALDMATKAKDLAARAWVAVAAGVYEAGLGHWEVATNHFDDTKLLAHELGDGRRSDDASQNLAAVLWHRGDVAGSLGEGERLHESGKRRKDAYMEAEGLRRRAYGLLWLGRYRDAEACIDALRELRREDENAKPAQRHSDVHALSALLHLRRAQFVEAEEQAILASKVHAAAPPMFYDLVVDYAAVAEVLVTLLEQQKLSRSGLARRAVKQLGSLARLFPVAEPAAAYWQGQLCWVSGQTARALRHWKRALELSGSLAMPVYEALAHLALGQHLEQDIDEKFDHLARAEELLQELGDRYHFEQAQRGSGNSSVSLRRPH